MEKSAFSAFIFMVVILSFSGCAAALVRCGNCGRIPVPYPLSTGPNCGDQAYKIRCTAGELWFDALKGSYMIISINPLTQRIILRPPSFLAKTCISGDIGMQGIQLDDNLPFNITGSNTIMLLNCTDAMLHLQAPINCTSTSICHNYIKDNAAECMRTPLCCVFKTGGSQTAYVVRIHDGGCLAYQSFVNFDTVNPPKKWPEPGLEIEWELPQEPVCKTQLDCKNLLHSSCASDPMKVGSTRCLCKKGFTWDPINGLCRSAKCRPGKRCKNQKKLTVLICGMAAAVAGVSLAIMVGILVRKQRQRVKRELQKRRIKEREEMLRAKNNGKSARIFTGKEITRATNNFSAENLIGSGGFGEVFKGTLDDGTLTAIKRAKLGNTKGTDQVLNEVRILCQVNHRCLVRLLGCCVELDHPILIYEFIPNGTLFDHLHCHLSDKYAPLTWLRRLRIAHQTTEGLAYLHFGAVPPIYHRDVKSSNILLDEKLNAKVADFGLSRLVESTEGGESHIYTSAQGTLGYLDPEYYRSFQLSDRSDVYSFGVVLLELLTSKKAIDFNREGENVNLVVYMKNVMDEDKLMEVVDPVIKEGATNLELETIKALGLLAASCLDDKRQNRPSMKEVADEIEYIISIATGEICSENQSLKTGKITVTSRQLFRLNSDQHHFRKTYISRVIKMKALILVGGFGTRLRPLTLSVPKPLVDFANKPMILHQIEALKAIGVTEVVLAINYQPEVVLNFLKEFEKKLDIKITCSQETEPLGTAGPLALARDKLIDGSGEPFFVLNSDVISEYPLKEMINFHKGHGGEASIAVTKVDEPSKYGVVVMDETTGKVESFVEKPKIFVGNKINAGIYLLNPSVLDRIDLRPTSIEKEVFPNIAAANKLYAMVLPGFWMDIGQPRDYITGMRFYLDSLRKKSSAELASGSHFIGNVLVDESAVIGDGCLIGPDVAIGPRCVIESGVRLSRCSIMRGVRIKKHACVSNSIIGWHSTVGRWARLENMTILGEDVHFGDEVYSNGGVVLPHKEIKSSILKPEIVM
ncbi:hypothetical protein V6N13_005968 [Hibiscus sabdariffa]|uniref:mannose-1-phosphate guanylyltransferase n=1 Tax=Hibiscus sabdariffa TaxID=183260 RepID=A0ABR2EP66_9ROSI